MPARLSRGVRAHSMIQRTVRNACISRGAGLNSRRPRNACINRGVGLGSRRPGGACINGGVGLNSRKPRNAGINRGVGLNSRGPGNTCIGRGVELDPRKSNRSSPIERISGLRWLSDPIQRIITLLLERTPDVEVIPLPSTKTSPLLGNPEVRVTNSRSSGTNGG